MTDDNCRESFLPAEPLDDPQVRQAIAECEAQIEALNAEQVLTEAKAKDLIQKEAAGEGPFPQEIYALKRRKLEIATDVQALRARINRAKFGIM